MRWTLTAVNYLARRCRMVGSIAWGRDCSIVMGLEVGVLSVGISVTALAGAESPMESLRGKACTLCPLSQLSGIIPQCSRAAAKRKSRLCVLFAYLKLRAVNIEFTHVEPGTKIASIRLPPNSSWWENVMAYRLSIRRSATRAIAWLAAALFLASMPILAGAAAPVQAQVAVKADFRTALEPHGTWRNSSRWGEVWVPSNRPRDWQPYTVGHWVFTDDWGWYWIEDQSEAVWGVVTYHYGRWVLEDDVWIWMPGEEWGPGWVNWRGSN